MLSLRAVRAVRAVRSILSSSTLNNKPILRRLSTNNGVNNNEVVVNRSTTSILLSGDPRQVSRAKNLLTRRLSERKYDGSLSETTLKKIFGHSDPTSAVSAFLYTLDDDNDEAVKALFEVALIESRFPHQYLRALITFQKNQFSVKDSVAMINEIIIGFNLSEDSRSFDDRVEIFVKLKKLGLSGKESISLMKIKPIGDQNVLPVYVYVEKMLNLGLTPSESYDMLVTAKNADFESKVREYALFKSVGSEEARNIVADVLRIIDDKAREIDRNEYEAHAKEWENGYKLREAKAHAELLHDLSFFPRQVARVQETVSGLFDRISRKV